MAGGNMRLVDYEAGVELRFLRAIKRRENDIRRDARSGMAWADISAKYRLDEGDMIRVLRGLAIMRGGR